METLSLVVRAGEVGSRLLGRFASHDRRNVTQHAEQFATHVGGKLCGGFGVRGTEMVAKAVDYKIPVGVVRFDCHPGLGFKSGDEIF